MNCEEIKNKLVSLCTEIFQHCGVDTSLLEYVDLVNDIGMDSIMFITLVVEIENTFNITVPDNLLTIDKFRDIGSIVCIISEQIA